MGEFIRNLFLLIFGFEIPLSSLLFFLFNKVKQRLILIYFYSILEIFNSRQNQECIYLFLNIKKRSRIIRNIYLYIFLININSNLDIFTKFIGSVNSRYLRFRLKTLSVGEFGWGGTSVKRQHRCPKGSSMRTEISCRS